MAGAGGHGKTTPFGFPSDNDGRLVSEEKDHHEAIAELLGEGRHREAGELLLQRGELTQAMEAFAAVWDYAKAAEIAKQAGDATAELDYLLRSRDRGAAAAALEELAARDETEVEGAVALLLRRGEQAYAARLLEARGQLVQAAELVQKLGELREAAHLYERAGRFREAGRLYERLLQTEPDDGDAAVSLGLILKRYGKHELAAQMFQSAARDEEHKRQALRGLVCSLDALGLRDAAESTLAELLELDGSVRPGLTAFVAAEAEEERKQADEAEGQWFSGRYHVLRLIGGGAVGRVYLARDALYDRQVALKVLAAGSADQTSRDAFGRFAREAEVAAHLQHPNIVRVLDFQRETGVLVMEYLEGGTLADRLGQGPLSLEGVRELLVALLAALETAHLRGVVHRDVKPQNVLYSRGGGIKLADFGVAHLQDLGLTQTGAFIGTLTYMAPEQITGSQVSAATDLYALGATLYHALCGQPPFTGADLVAQHLASPPRPPSAVRPELGTRFDELLSRLLAKAPTDRFASAAEVRRRAATIDYADPGHCSVPPQDTAMTQAEAPQGPFVDVAHGQGQHGQPRHALYQPLELPVLVIHPATTELLSHYQELAPVMSPYLQLVLDLDEPEQRVVLERPQGRPLTERLAGYPVEVAHTFAWISQLASALNALHEGGRTHGQLDADHVIVGTHRAVLLLPSPRLAPAEAAADVTALVALWAHCLGHQGDIHQLLAAEGPLAATLGRRRRERLVASLPIALEAVTLQRVAEEAQRALAERHHHQRHLHALAAAARARGADPHRGPLRAFLHQRSADFDQIGQSPLQGTKDCALLEERSQKK
jgi:serine/threonine-protein kinase